MAEPTINPNSILQSVRKVMCGSEFANEFDTDLHEAVAQFPVQEEDQKGKVFDVVQTGYTLNGKVIRFAKVVVGI